MHDLGAVLLLGVGLQQCRTVRRGELETMGFRSLGLKEWGVSK